MNARTWIKTAFLALGISSLGFVGLSGRAEAQLSARVFVVPPHNEIHMASGSAQWCVNVEPIGNNFNVTDINACTVTLSSAGTGSVSSISLDCTKPVVVGDSDGNGIQDIRFCFLKTAMAPLFDHLHGASPKTVTMTVNGNFITGGSFGGSVTLLLYLKS